MGCRYGGTLSCIKELGVFSPMRNLKRICALTLLAVMLMGMAGCMCANGDITIREDGSGTITAFAGMTKQALDQMDISQEIDYDDEGNQVIITTGGNYDVTGMDKFTKNGKTYYGEKETKSFATLDELMEILNSGEVSIDEAFAGTTFLFERDSKNQILMTVHYEAGTTDEYTQGGGNTSSDFDFDMSYDEELAAQYAKDIYIGYTFNFPATVLQTAGYKNGISIKGGTVELNFMKIEEDLKNKGASYCDYKFRCVKTYSDLDPNAWYFAAIERMVDMGLLNGMGDGTFKPNDDITYAQICTIIAKHKGMDFVASPGDHWASTFVNYCVTSGFLDMPVNIDAPMTRQEAVSVIYRAYGYALPDKHNYVEGDISDFGTISTKYQAEILAAFNKGITSGNDAQRTFAPWSHLTRAQVCQLIYNVI